MDGLGSQYCGQITQEKKWLPSALLEAQIATIVFVKHETEILGIHNPLTHGKR